MKRYVCRLLSLPGGKQAPEWVHVVPFGRWEGHHSGNVLDITPEDGQAIVTNFEKRGIELVFDWEHQTIFTTSNGRPAPASGWADRLELRDDGVWAHIRAWTPVAKGQLESDPPEYKYCSPVLELASVDPRTGKPEGLWLSSVALTNVPFFAGELTPVVSRGVPMDLRALLIALLELPPEATDQQIHDAVKAMKEMQPPPGEAAASADPKTPEAKAAAAKAKLGAVVCNALGWGDKPPAKAEDKLKALLAHEGYVPESEVLSLRAELEAAKFSASEGAVEQLAAKGLEAGKLTPALKPHFVKMAQRDLAAAKAWLDNQPVLVKFGAQATKPSTNSPGSEELSAEEQAVCKQMSLTPAQFVAGRR